MNVPRTHRPATFARGLAAALLSTVAIHLLEPLPAAGASVSLRPSKDNTIYGPGTASLSNGAGSFLFAGTNGEKRVLRGLLAFNLAGQVPAGATINSVSLTLAIDTPKNITSTVQLRRLLADWGEGTSVALSGGGGGAAATTGDATWNARFFNTVPWTTPGGDFSSTVSASQRVTGLSGSFTFTSPALAADVQAWVNNPGSNFGWILMAQVESAPAVRFASREGSPAPTLVIDYTAGGGSDTAPAIAAQPASQSVAAGGGVTFGVSATGTPAPAYQWQKNGAAISGATGATLTLAGISAADAGTYAVVVSNSAGSVTSDPATLSVVTGGGSDARLSNLSVRATMAAGQTLIVGFSVSGGGRSILVRGVGPTLANFGLAGVMADPRLELYDGSTLVSQNDNWGSTTALSAAFASVGAFPLIAGSLDAAFLQAIDGTRSVQLKGTGPGVVLVELYDTGPGNSPRLINVSARNRVGTGDDILIVGFVVAGTGTKNLLIRAVGPRLADLGVGDVLADPRLDVFRADASAAITGNDNWDGSLAATFNAVGAFSLLAGSKDAALVTTLAPGAYTVQVSGVNNGTGEALVEIYEVP